MLNKKQKVVLIIGLITIISITVFPPMVFYFFSDRGGELIIMGEIPFGFILDTPKIDSGNFETKAINYQNYYIRLLVSLILTSGMILIFQDRKKKDGGDA